MSDWEMSIEKVDNGYLLKFSDVQYAADVETPTVRREVVAEDDSEWGHLEAGLMLIYRMMDFFDLTGSKHDERRIQVSISGPGDEE